MGSSSYTGAQQRKLISTLYTQYTRPHVAPPLRSSSQPQLEANLILEAIMDVVSIAPNGYVHDRCQNGIPRYRGLVSHLMGINN